MDTLQCQEQNVSLHEITTRLPRSNINHITICFFLFSNTILVYFLLPGLAFKLQVKYAALK